jgi:uncharacterized OB-fold protein
MTAETSRKVYFPAFGREACEACGKKTDYKLCDRIITTCGSTYTNCRPLCVKCHRRITKATAKAVKL